MKTMWRTDTGSYGTPISIHQVTKVTDKMVFFKSGLGRERRELKESHEIMWFDDFATAQALAILEGQRAVVRATNALAFVHSRLEGIREFKEPTK